MDTFDSLHIDSLLISETKIDSSFRPARFHLERYATPNRLDRNANAGGMLLFIRENIPSTSLISDLSAEGNYCVSLIRKERTISVILKYV